MEIKDRNGVRGSLGDAIPRSVKGVFSWESNNLVEVSTGRTRKLRGYLPLTWNKMDGHSVRPVNRNLQQRPNPYHR